MDIKKKIESLPQTPGVYLMQDKNGAVIYVGKAANIRKRAASYFNKPQASYKNEILARQIQDIKIIPTISEHEAFLLESKLIKQLKPRYNISLKDDKSFPFIKITKENYPRVFIGRKKPGEKVEYFGPYTNAKLLRLALKSLRKAFKFCICRVFPKKTCLDFHIGLCSAPCAGEISKSDYRKNIRDFKIFLRKGSASFIKDLEKRMKLCAENKKFEDAIKLREKIKALGLISDQAEPKDWGIFGLDRQPRRIEAFDISNISGAQAVGSMVTFIDNNPSKNDYRRFKIKMIWGIDDYAMLREVLERRYKRIINDNLEKPDLIVIDGGRGHLNVALKEIYNLSLDIPIIAIAKGEELIYTVKNGSPLKLERESPMLQLIQHIRDEAHRFAINYHKLLRKKKTFERIKAL
ncbi:MAG: excinuclease ABC subunit UvrC [Candidatus Omnitrophica bacterium]|nr:excinuclease ABC subunit UvrC [Candidatus Omnitrophota bacterium]